MATDGPMTFRITGSIELGLAVPQPDELAQPSTPPLTISGRLINARSGYGLPGLTVSAYVLGSQDPADTEPSKAPSEEILLGDGVSDDDGYFQITFKDTTVVRQKLHLLASFEDLFVLLKVYEGERFLHTSDRLNVAAGSIVVTLPVTLPEVEVTTDMWAALGARLEKSRITQVNLLAQQLAAPDGLFLEDWRLETRQAALVELERAFLDPGNILSAYASPLPTLNNLCSPGELEHFEERLRPGLDRPEVRRAFADFAGKVRSFSDLFGVDWTMDLNEFREGKVSTAINKYIDAYRSGVSEIFDIIPVFKDSFGLYRDYLREIWPTWITKVIYIQPQGWTSQKALDQLSTRFHQNFFTYDNTSRPVNEVLIPIVKEILMAPAGDQWGFGIAPAMIDPQGTRTFREYLDYLIGLTGLSARMLGLRYRLDLTRTDASLSSPVQENIATLQGFYRDSFQCELEPTHTAPDVLNQPIVPDKLQGKAPFFLHYEEWLRQQAPFYPENFFDIRRTLPIDVVPSKVQELRNWLKGAIQNTQPVSGRADWQFVWDIWDIGDKLNEGHNQFHRGEYILARDLYLEAKRLAYSAIQSKLVSAFDIKSKFAARKKLSVKNMKELGLFMKPTAFGPHFAYGHHEYSRDDMIVALIYYCIYVIPVCLGDTYLELGDFEQSVFYYGQTTRFAVGVARETNTGGYRPHYLREHPLYHRGDRPYTVNLHQGRYEEYPLEGDSGEYYDTTIYSPVEQRAVDLIAKYVHPAEAKYFRLRQGNAMLEWADALYRTNDAVNIQRARELYKGVSFLHGEIPPICPDWPKDWPYDLGFAPFLNQHENPAVVLQKVRARKGFFQIEAKLNYYGETNDVVPALRYRPLKVTADRFAALAKAAQQDFLLYMEKMENALADRMKLSNLLQKAALQINIAQEQIKIAEYGVTVAQGQVATVKDQIAAKEKEIADAESFFSQLGDFLGGMAGFVEGGVKVGGGLAEGADFFGWVSKDAIKAAGSKLGSEALMGVGAGGAAMVGAFAAFAAVGYATMSSMAEASTRRAAELRVLRDRALFLAEGQVEAKGREVKIASYQKQIAQADLDLARNLIQFEENKFLNLNFWANLAQTAKRLLRRYLELGTRMAWLAERALSYEQDRSIQIIRLDYFPEKTQGVPGADLLQADLAELEATRIEGIKRSVPVKHTFSLARDFPLQFGQLRQTGRCTFKTEELPFTLAYPGTTGYRVRAVSLLVTQTNLMNPVRGLLINQGISISHPGQPNEHVIVRPAEALPISEFKLQNDMAVYSLPDETLLTFEGSAVETFWEIHLPLAVNAGGYNGIADVLLTLDLWAQYSPDLYDKQLANMPKTVRRWVLMSGKQYQPSAITDLAGAPNNVAVAFNVSALRLPAREKNRKLKNIAVFFVSPAPIDGVAKLSATSPATTVSITFKKGIAMSNIPPTADEAVPPPMPLNVLADVAAEQRFTLSIVKSNNPGVDFSGVSDVVLAVEYQADVI